jgi:hypothetical protein
MSKLRSQEGLGTKAEAAYATHKVFCTANDSVKKMMSVQNAYDSDLNSCFFFVGI